MKAPKKTNLKFISRVGCGRKVSIARTLFAPLATLCLVKVKVLASVEASAGVSVGGGGDGCGAPVPSAVMLLVFAVKRGLEVLSGVVNSHLF